MKANVIFGNFASLRRLLLLFAVPLAVRVHSGLVRFYDNPYALMDSMAANINLHMIVSLLLLVGYLLAIADQTLLGRRPFFLS